jgi:hypothetical protein
MSRPNQVRIMLVLAFLLTLVAGIVVGAGFARSMAGIASPPPPVVTAPTTKSTTNPTHRDWFPDRLGLTGDQRAKWTAIWKDTPSDKFKEIGTKERSCYQTRDEAIKNLYTTEQKEEKDRISDEYRAKIGELYREREKAISALYSPEQKAQKERLEKDCAAKVAALKAERDRLMQPLLDKSRLILTDEQRNRFDSMLRAGPGQGPDRGHRGGPPSGMSPGGNSSRRGSGSQPSTRPSTLPANAPQATSALGSSL